MNYEIVDIFVLQHSPLLTSHSSKVRVYNDVFNHCSSNFGTLNFYNMILWYSTVLRFLLRKQLRKKNFAHIMIELAVY